MKRHERHRGQCGPHARRDRILQRRRHYTEGVGVQTPPKGWPQDHEPKRPGERQLKSRT